MELENLKKINLIFMPISVFTGMAGTMRLQNLIIHLQEYSQLNIFNFILINAAIEETNDTVFGDKVKPVVIKYNLKNPLNILNFYIVIIKQFTKIYKKKQKNIIYHYGYPNIKNFFILISAKIVGFKIIFDIVEDNTTIIKYKSLLSAIKIRSSVFLFMHIYWLADGAIGISKHLFEKLKKVSHCRFPIIHLPISINPKLFTNQPRLINNMTTIFYGGSFGEKDGLEYLLKAFDKIAHENPSVQLILSGKGSKIDMNRFFEMLTKIENQVRVKYLGYISYDEYINHLKNSDILCITRNASAFASAGFPFKLGEMLATGNSVIVTDVGDIREYITNEEACIVPPESVDDIIICIKNIINNPQKYKSIANKGKLIASQCFSSKELAERLYNFLYII